MARLVEILTANWLVVLLAALACIYLARAFRRFTQKSFSFRLLRVPVFCVLLLLGHFLCPVLVWKRISAIELALFVGAVGTAVLFIELVVLSASGGWSQTLALICCGISSFSLGGFALSPIQEGAITSVRAFRTLQFVHPEWLWLFALIPVIILMSRRSLAALGPTRRRIAVGLRCIVVGALVIALAEARLRRPSDQLAVIYVVDRSVSIPPDLDPATLDNPGGAVDRRWVRIQNSINESVLRRGGVHRDDLSGVILFARRPKLVLPARAVDRLVINPDMIRGIDDTYTDIAAALKLAMASFPEGCRKRIVLFSDGNENLGNAQEQAEIARKNGVQIDTIALASGQRNENEVMVQAVEAPPRLEKGTRLPIRVFVRNAHPTRIIPGLLELIQNRNGAEKPLPIQMGPGVVDGGKSPARVDLQPGINVFTFRDKADDDKKEEEISLSYRALFQPLQSIPGDRIQNNRALAHVIARDNRRVLFLESEGTQLGNFTHEYLIDRLIAAKFEVHPLNIARLPKGRDDLMHFLSTYGCVVIANVPAEMIGNEQQEAIRSNTHDQGCGFVMIGGPDSYGAGGYQDTAIEKALPVDCNIKALSAAGKGGLVLIMHASEMADGNQWQKVIAKLAIRRLAPVDMVGVLFYDLTTQWHIPFQTVGPEKGRLLSMVDRMTPGDMPDFDPFLKSAYDTLSNPVHGLATRHIIVISDGDPSLGGIGQRAIQDMKTAGITCTTVGVATHGAPENKRLEGMAVGRPGQEKPPFYNVTNPRQLPEIYIKESRRVSQSFLFERKFEPRLLVKDGPTEGLGDALPPLYGFIRTTLKASPLAQMLVEGPNSFDQRFPILATWQYGLGRAAAFTSDARSKPPNVNHWDRDWASSDTYLKFWEQTIAWALRGGESDRLMVVTDYREGKVQVTIEARDPKGVPITDMVIDAKVTVPGAPEDNSASVDLQFSQRQGGSYEAEFRAEDVGSYIINVAAKQTVPGYNGRFKKGLPRTLTQKNGRLYLTDGTEARRLKDGKLVYADNGEALVEGQYESVDRQRSAVTVSYSPEYADLESNTAILKNLSRITGGKAYPEDFDQLLQLAKYGEFYRSGLETNRGLQPLWYWMAFVAVVALFFDVAVRRISVEPAEVAQVIDRIWRRLRHRATSTAQIDYLERLRQRKEASDDKLERMRSGRRFEGPATPQGPPPAGADATPIVEPKPPPPEAKPPEEPAAGEDYFEKLRRAKKRAPHERGDKKDGE